MENNLHSSTQFAKNKMPSFEELYDTKLAPAIEKFKAVRRKLYFSIGFTISGIIILASVLFMTLYSLGYEDKGGMLKIWFFLLFVTMIFLLINAGKRKVDRHKEHLMMIYFFFNFAGFFLFIFLNDIESHDNSLLLCVSMISVSIGLIIFIASGILDNYTRQYRKIVIGELVKNMGINMRYTPEGVVSKQEFRDSGMKILSSGDYAGCDLIELEYGTQQFKFSNIRVTNRGSSPKDNFMSVFLVADISRKLKGTTKIANRDVGKVEGFLKDMVSVDKLAMPTNYPELEKYFKVSATHPQESEALLIPTFVRQLLRFSRKINLRYTPNAPMLFRLHLKQQKLYMSFMFNGSDGRLFHTPKLTEQVDYKNMLRISYTRLKIVMDTIKDLHLTDTEWANEQN